MDYMIRCIRNPNGVKKKHAKTNDMTASCILKVRRFISSVHCFLII